MRRYFEMDRIKFGKLNQCMIIPTFGITWRNTDCKFAIAFAWLCWGFYIKCSYYEEDD